MRDGAYVMAKLTRILQALADPTRRRITALLRVRDELCVCEIVDALRLPQYQVSRHLRTLRSAGVVTGSRQGRWMHYRLNPRLARADRGMVAAICERADAEPAVRADALRLQACLRPRDGCAPRILRCANRRSRA
jgi:ArsR family transcriptional regulator